MINGKLLTGEMFVELIDSYVKSINSGACPNIEDAWSQMSRLENDKSMQLALEFYQKLL